MIKSYVESRLQCAKSVLLEGMDNPLDDQNSLIQQLDQVYVLKLENILEKIKMMT